MGCGALIAGTESTLHSCIALIIRHPAFAWKWAKTHVIQYAFLRTMFAHSVVILLRLHSDSIVGFMVLCAQPNHRSGHLRGYLTLPL